jgi:hypothetical protein
MSNEQENSGAWFTSPMRVIVREPLYEKQLRGLAMVHKRIGEVLAGLEPGLAAYPEFFHPIPGEEYCVALTHPYPTAPALRILFTYTATEMRLHAIEFSKEEESD